MALCYLEEQGQWEISLGTSVKWFFNFPYNIGNRVKWNICQHMNWDIDMYIKPEIISNVFKCRCSSILKEKIQNLWICYQTLLSIYLATHKLSVFVLSLFRPCEFSLSCPKGNIGVTQTRTLTDCFKVVLESSYVLCTVALPGSDRSGCCTKILCSTSYNGTKDKSQLDNTIIIELVFACPVT